MRHACSAPRAKFRVLDGMPVGFGRGARCCYMPVRCRLSALDQVFGRGTSEHEFFTPFGWQNLATWRNCVFRHDISELGNMSLDEFGEDTLLLSLFHQESFGLLRICRILECLIPLDG